MQFRVREILQVSKKEDWRHVNGEMNPADLVSRGATASVLSESELWWNGPEWLKRGECEWPATLLLNDSEEIGQERRRALVLQVVEEKDNRIGNIIDINKFSTLGRLLRVTALVTRFCYNLK